MNNFLLYENHQVSTQLRDTRSGKWITKSDEVRDRSIFVTCHERAYIIILPPPPTPVAFVGANTA